MYNEDNQRKIIYLLRKMSKLKNGHTLSVQFTDGYPFASYVNRFGNITLSNKEMTKNFIYKFLEENPNIKSNIDLVEIAWQFYFVYGTANGDLYKNNKLFSSIKSGKGLTLLHITSHLKDIIKSGLLYPSGGCLGASIYSVPLREDNRIHNLAKFIKDYEFPYALKSKERQTETIDTIAIHIEQESFIHSNNESNGLDYLLMGQLQSDIYNMFKTDYEIDKDIFSSLESVVITQIQKVREFLNICVEYNLSNISTDKFINEFEQALLNIPFLGYIYFEVLVEYVTLFQNDELSLKLKEIGEINNIHYKTMVFDLSPNLFKAFKLTEFKPKVIQVIEYLKEKSLKNLIITDFSEQHFAEFFKWRVAQYVRFKLMNKRLLVDTDNFEKLISENSSLIGHLVHREIRVNKAIKEHNRKYDIARAEAIWNLWNEDNVVFPYNSIVPKGEVGINPKYDDLYYRIHKTKINPITGEVRFLDELNIKLAFELVDSTFSELRSPKH